MKICAMCGKDFIPNCNSQKYCGSLKEKTGCIIISRKNQMKLCYEKRIQNGKLKEYKKINYAKNKESILEYNRQWCKNSDKFKEKNKLRSEINRYGDTRENILNRFNNKCYECGDIDELEIHHIDGNGSNKPYKEKNNHPDNIMVLCRYCHERIQYALYRSKNP